MSLVIWCMGDLLQELVHQHLNDPVENMDGNMRRDAEVCSNDLPPQISKNTCLGKASAQPP